MHQDLQTVDIGKLIIRLSAAGGLDLDLDGMLAHLHEVLGKLPAFPVRGTSVIRLYNSENRLVTVAQHGLPPVWQQPAAADRFAPLTAVEGISLAQATDGEQFLVLPLAIGNARLGQAAIGVAGDWQPGTGEIALLTDLGTALSGSVSYLMMKETLALREMELEDARSQVIKRLGIASEFRDNETGMHIMRMTNIALAIAKELAMPQKQRDILSVAAPMHDVGKIGISDAIMLKPGRLSEEEFAVMKTHTEIGERLLAGCDSLVEAARDIALCHHENWDGSGYPRGLKGERISIFARICAVADVFDALTSRRPYKEAWPVAEAVGWIRGEAGRKFDPAVVQAFEDALPEILRILELYREEIINPRQRVKLPEPFYSNTRWVIWDASLSVGIDVIDEHHRYLFDLTNDLINVMVNRRGTGALLRLLSALSDYAEVHFRAEERMMEHFGYAGLDRQKEQHQTFQERLRRFAVDLHDYPVVTQVELVGYLRGWLVGHIKHEDTLLRALVTG